MKKLGAESQPKTSIFLNSLKFPQPNSLKKAATLTGSQFKAPSSAPKQLGKGKKDGGKEGEKLVAAGTVVNDKIRVVPVKEKKERSGKEGRGRPKKPEVLTPSERKKDPNFKCSVPKGGKNKKKKSPLGEANGLTPTGPGGESTDGGESASGTDHDSSSVSCLADDEEGSSLKRSLRQRKKNNILNIDYMCRVQHDFMITEFNKKSQSGKKEKTSARKSKETEIDNWNPKFDIDADTPETYLRASGRTADWDCYLNTKNTNYLKRIVDVSTFPHVRLVTAL